MPNDQRLIIGVAGKIGSGKSEIAHLIERECGFRYLRYSLILAEWFKADPNAKQHLQTVGWEVMSGDGQTELNRRLIASIDQYGDYVVDGLRHLIDFESLKKEFGLSFHLFYIDSPPEIRFERLRHRYRSMDEFIAADHHPVESNIESLRSLASVELCGALPLHRLSIEVQSAIESLRTKENS
jgi:dephospho-CoA kinase